MWPSVLLGASGWEGAKGASWGAEVFALLIWAVGTQMYASLTNAVVDVHTESMLRLLEKTTGGPGWLP